MLKEDISLLQAQKNDSISISFIISIQQQQKAIRSLKSIQMRFLGYLQLSSLGILFHFFHSSVSSLLHLIYRTENFLLVDSIKSFFVFLHFPKNFWLIFRDCFLKLFHFFLELSVLTHCNMIVHFEITLFIVVIDQEGS